jgi:hypothetical protein
MLFHTRQRIEPHRGPAVAEILHAAAEPEGAAWKG